MLKRDLRIIFIQQGIYTNQRKKAKEKDRQAFIEGERERKVRPEERKRKTDRHS